MPFRLNSFCGGLGNQIFSIVTIFCFSKKYNTTFSFNKTQTAVKSVCEFKIPVYSDSVFSQFLLTNEYKENSNSQSEYTVHIPQFTDFIVPDRINIQDNLISIEGLPMKYSIYKDYLEDISALFYKQKQLYIPYMLSSPPRLRRVGIMFRTFIQESSSQWMVKPEYYFDAIQYILKKNGFDYDYEFHIYSDVPSIGEEIINKVANKLVIYPKIYEFVGARDNKTDVKHFFQMFDLDDYILCNSTHHYWPALLSKYKVDRIVTFPTYTQDGNRVDWFKHIVPDHWVQL